MKKWKPRCPPALSITKLRGIADLKVGHRVYKPYYDDHSDVFAIVKAVDVDRRETKLYWPRSNHTSTTRGWCVFDLVGFGIGCKSTPKGHT